MPLDQRDYPLPCFIIKFQLPKHLLRQLSAHRLMAAEVIHAIFAGEFTGGLAHVVEEHRQPQDQTGGSRLYRANGMLPAAPAVPGGVLLQRDQRLQLGPELAEHVGILPQNGPGAAACQKPAQLPIDPLRRHMVQHSPVFVDGCGGFPLNFIAEYRPKPQGPHHPQAVLPEPLIGLPHAADHTGADILFPAEGVMERSLQVHGDGIHGKIPPGQVGL